MPISAKSWLVKPRCLAETENQARPWAAAADGYVLNPPAADSRLVARWFPVARVLNVAKSE